MSDKLIFLTNSYQKQIATKLVSLNEKGDLVDVVLEQTVFYPQGGGQPADTGTIHGKNGTVKVTHCKMVNGDVVHTGTLSGTIEIGESVTAEIEWHRRYENMRRHSGGHLLHEIVLQNIPGLTPVKAEHGKGAFIEYDGMVNPKVAQTLQTQTNMLIAENRALTCEFVTFEELSKRAAWVPPHLPKHKPLRIVTIDGFPPMADGGTMIRTTGEIGEIKVGPIVEKDGHSRVYYEINSFDEANVKQSPKESASPNATMQLSQFSQVLVELKTQLLTELEAATGKDVETLKITYFGSNGLATKAIHQIKLLPIEDRKAAGKLVNEFKAEMMTSIEQKSNQTDLNSEWFDVTLPGITPSFGHLHIVSQAIEEITDIYARIGFTRMRHPEVDWDYYAFEALNMPPSHPARDEWETFFVDYPGKPERTAKMNKKRGKMLLTPQTSNGQVREMEKGYLPIRMINIAKCYRRQSDVSHVPMFHQFEGLYVDKHVSIGHLKGVFDYFVKNFFGENRKTRLRPYHFQFTEPSFEVDISCGVCLGTAKLSDGSACRLCKQGWLELGGAGMVHPNVLKYGGIDTDVYNGFAFGWGVERTYMMKAGTKLDDIRLLYSNDVRFLEQF